MKPISFKEQNIVFAAPTGMDNCDSLPAFRGDGQCISLWKASWRERFEFLFRGKIWLGIYGHEQPPVYLTVDKSIFEEGKK